MKVAITARPAALSNINFWVLSSTFVKAHTEAVNAQKNKKVNTILAI